MLFLMFGHKSSKSRAMKFILLIFALVISSANLTPWKREVKEPDVDSDGKYNGGYNTDCSETMLLTLTRSTARIEPEEDLFGGPIKCHWNVIGSDSCIPIMDCSKFKLKPDKSSDKTCPEEYLEITDGSGGYQRFCGDQGPKDLTTAKGLRDLYITFKGGDKLDGKGFSCSVKCSIPGTGKALKALEENSEADVSGECTCGRKPNRNRIVGGQDAKRGDFPWITALVTTGTRRPFCGGTLINSNFILTAAHCFKGPYQNVKNFELLLNAHALDLTKTGEFEKSTKAVDLGKLKKEDESDGAVRFGVEKYFIHPLYVRQTNDFDVALIKIRGGINFKTHGDRIQPACIPPLATYNNTLENSKGIVAGWGLSSSNATVTMAILQKLDVTVLTNVICKGFYKERITRRMMCAGYEEGGKDSCKGDSGGPLIRETSPQIWQLMGIVSWGEGCAAAKSPGVYQRVAEVNQWIRYISNLEDAVWCQAELTAKKSMGSV